MSKLRLTIFIGSFTVGGGQQVVYELLRKIDQSRVAVNVICYEGKVNTRTEQEIEELCPITYLNAKGKITLRKILCVFAALKACKPDVVHVHLGGMAYAVPWSFFYRVPLLITAHTKPSQAFVPMVLPLIRWGLRRKLIRIAAVSKENTLMMRKYFAIDDDRIVCVNNGIDVDRFYRIDHDLFTYINVARQDENKNQEQIIRCFSELVRRNLNVRLLLIGDGPCHEKLKQLVFQMGLQESVDILGMRSDVEKFYAISDVYVQASHREALPMSALEAMAAHLPILATNVGGMKDIVTDNGILVPDCDDVAMTTAMINLYGMPRKDMERMQACSRSTVAEYSSENMARMYIELYGQMQR